MANEFLVEISARHVHVTKETLEVPSKRSFHSPVSSRQMSALPS